MVASKFEDALLHFHVQKRRIIMNYHQIHNDTQMFETDNSSRHIGPFSSRTSKHWMDHLQENHIFVVKKRSKRRFPIYFFFFYSRSSWKFAGGGRPTGTQASVGRGWWPAGGLEAFENRFLEDGSMWEIYWPILSSNGNDETGCVTGWWFGTFFSIYWECHHPNWL